jgi:hypothetical protein
MRASHRLSGPIGLLVLAGAVLAACGSSSATTTGYAPAPPSVSSNLAALAFGPVPSNYRRPTPNAFQERILAHKTITYSEYVAALEAARSCAVQELPGLRLPLEKDPYDTAILSFGLSIPSQYTKPVPKDAPPSTQPPGTTYVLEQVDNCIYEYAATVNARWIQQQSLSSSQLASERPAFIACLRSAGVRISPNASYYQIRNTIDTKGALDYLNNEQLKEYTTCVQTYFTFANTLY